jgi:hypothetical protein
LLEALESAHVASFPLSLWLVVVMAGLSAARWRDRHDCIGADPINPVPVADGMTQATICPEPAQSLPRVLALLLPIGRWANLAWLHARVAE